MSHPAPDRRERLLVVLGDQLDPAHALIDDLDPATDRVFLAEVREEATHVWSHKARIVLFLSAMRHFRDALLERGLQVTYLELDQHQHAGLAAALAAELQAHPPQLVTMLKAGDARVQEAIERAVELAGISIEVHEDPHFLTDEDTFNTWLAGRKQPRMEYFYRTVRRQHNILMDDDKPVGGKWNFDAANRGAFDRHSHSPRMPPRAQ